MYFRPSIQIPNLDIQLLSKSFIEELNRGFKDSRKSNLFWFVKTKFFDPSTFESKFLDIYLRIKGYHNHMQINQGFKSKEIDDLFLHNLTGDKEMAENAL